MQIYHYARIPLLLSVLLTAEPLLAQDSTEQYRRPAIVKTNLLGPISLFVEAPITPRSSLQISFQRINLGLFSEVHFFNLTADYRYYLTKNLPSARRPAPKGVFVSPYLKYRRVLERGGVGFLSTNKDPYDEVAYAMFGGGAVVGTQLIGRRGFTLDAFLGGGYFPFIESRIFLNPRNYTTPVANPQDYRFDLRVGFSIGLAFPPAPTPVGTP